MVDIIKANRAPVLTLWAAVVAERLGFDWDEVLTLGRTVPAVQTPDGIRALSNERPTSPASVHRYLTSKFNAGLPDARAAMSHLAHSMPPHELAAKAYALYGRFNRRSRQV